jgi:DNA-binding transcriptional regulator YdaS (Cro superfamily)
MADFVNAAFQASQAVGGPCRLARRLGIEPDQLYRWIAGQDLPPEAARLELEARFTVAVVPQPASASEHRRHGDGPALTFGFL